MFNSFFFPRMPSWTPWWCPLPLANTCGPRWRHDPVDTTTKSLVTTWPCRHNDNATRDDMTLSTQRQHNSWLHDPVDTTTTQLVTTWPCRYNDNATRDDMTLSTQRQRRSWRHDPVDTTTTQLVTTWPCRYNDNVTRDYMTLSTQRQRHWRHDIYMTVTPDNWSKLTMTSSWLIMTWPWLMHTSS